MRKILFSILAGVLFAFPGTAQTVVIPTSVISSAGNSVTAGNIQLSWTLGELAVSTLEAGEYVISQGFQQSYLSVTEDTTNLVLNPINWNISAYPNPVSQDLKIQFNVPEETDFIVEIQDVAGKLIYQNSYRKVLPNDIINLDMSSYTSGLYFFRISTPDRKQMRVISISKI